MELNKTYVGGNNDNITNRFQVIGLLVPDYSEKYSVIWYDLNNSTLLGTDNYPNNPTANYDIFCRYKSRHHNTKHMYHPGRWH